MLRGFQNFDALANGTLPVGWTNGAGGNFQVGTNRPSSGTKCLSQAASLENVVCTWSAVASAAGNIAAQLTQTMTVSGNTSSATNLLVASDTAGTTGYVLALVYNAGWVLQFFKSTGGSAWNFITQAAAGFTPADGQAVSLKIDENIVAGVGTIRCKVWTGGPTAEPGAWNITYTDNTPVACKYVGVYAGSDNLAGVIANADDVYIGDSGDSFNLTVIPVTDANLYFSHRNTLSDGAGALQPSNVKSGSTYALGLDPGWYVKGGITGSTSCYLWLDTTALGSAGAGDCPRIKTRFDDAVLASAQLVAGSTIVPLATGQGTGNHTFQTTYYDSNPNVDQWNTPVGVKVLGLLVDHGGASAAPPTIKSKRLTFRSDSIGRGYCTDAGGNNGGDATHATPWLLASALGAELGNVSKGGMGWGCVGQGNVPAFFVPGNDAASSWNKLANGQSALVNGLESPMPDDVIAQLGTNDVLNAVPDATVTASVAGWLAAQRAAAPTARITIILPFGAFKKTAIIVGFTQYGGTILAETVGNGSATRYACANDPLCFLIDLGADAATGLTDPGSATAEAPNDGTGIHPSAARNGQLAAQEAGAMLSYGAPLANQTSVYLVTRDQSGEPKSGVIVEFQITGAPVNDTGNSYDKSVLQVASDANGVVQTALPAGASFIYRISSKNPAMKGVVPATGPYALPSIAGYYQ